MDEVPLRPTIGKQMNPDPASLDNLRDIVEPAAVPWWPPAPAWWILCAVLVVVVLVIAVRVWRTRRASAYRRAALQELRSATNFAEIAEILKRTALCVYPRTEVAALSGPDWCRWLGETGGAQVPDEVANALTSGVFEKVEIAGTDEVTAFASDWIKHHGNQTEAREGCKGA